MSDIVRAAGNDLPTEDASGADAPILHVVFRLADADYALPADIVVQMEEYTGASPVPGAPDFVAGVMQLRGKVVPVVDLRRRFGLAAYGDSDEAHVREQRRVVVGEIGDRRVALTVDSAREVMRLRPSQLKPPPKLLEADARGFVRSVVHVESRLILVLDFAKVIGEEAIDGGH